MSRAQVKQALHRTANDDTPNGVMIPENWIGLAMWAMGRFGVGIIFAGAIGYFAFIVYGDMRRDTERMSMAFASQAATNANTVTAIQQMTSTGSATVAALQQLTQAVDKLTAIQVRVDRNSEEIDRLRDLTLKKPTDTR